MKTAAEPIGFPERLTKLRTKRQMTQKEVAEQASIHLTDMGQDGICAMSISTYERGISLPRGDVLIALAQVFSVPARWLLTGWVNR